MVSSVTAQLPAKILTRTEFPRALFELSTLPASILPLILSTARGDGHPVLALPGFTAGDGSTALLRLFLSLKGYAAHGWQLGRNFGPKTVGMDGEKLLERVRALHARTGKKVSLVGLSLGGIMARQIGYQAPESVRQVIMLASAFRTDPSTSHAWPLYKRVTGQSAGDRNLKLYRDLADRDMPIPSTSIYSKQDGIVSWQSCLEIGTGKSQNIEVIGSHCGIGANPSVFYTIADRLALADGHWASFKSPLPLS